VTPEETKAAIEVMQAYADGAEVEFRRKSIGGIWDTCSPCWNWDTLEYRIKPKPREIWVNAVDGKMGDTRGGGRYFPSEDGAKLSAEECWPNSNTVRQVKFIEVLEDE